MKLLALLLLFAGAVHAAPLPEQNIANMVAQSEAVMTAGICAVAADSRLYPGETILVLLPIGPRTILRDDYNWLRGPGYAKGPSGRFVMSERIEEACRADAEGGRCIAARSFFRQDLSPPGQGVKPR